MNQFQSVVALLAQASGGTAEAVVSEAWYRQPFAAFLIIVATVVVAFLIAHFAMKQLRLAEQAWRLGVVLSCLLVATEVIALKWPPRLGVDLKGGVVFIAELAPAVEGEQVEPAQLVPRLKDRVDPTGTREIMIRPYGAKMIEIVIPDVGDQEADRIWRTLVQAGAMQFRIVADVVKHGPLLQIAQAQAESGRVVRIVSDNEGKPVGRWVGIGRRYDPTGKPLAYRWTPSPANLVRDAVSGRIVDTTLAPRSGEDNEAFSRWIDQQGIEELEVLVALDAYDVTGDYLANPRASVDDRGRPCVNFQLQGNGIRQFYRLTSENIEKPLGIVMDDRLLSAPGINNAISQSGQILGDFSAEEVEELVNILKAGRLPGTLNKAPVSKDQVDSNIGQQMRESGLLAIAVSFGLVMVFMVVYYLRAGVIACLALLINVALIIAVTMLIKFPFSLTSLAGLVLTVGMSVDANVLIFERIREELARGSALRMAIRNGFERATATIVDANLTTLLTAIVLYLIGTEHIRGFAVTLTLGIVSSMFTAIFCSRVFFEIGEKKRLLGSLKMLEVFGGRQISFMSMWGKAITASLVVIVIGLVAVVVRGPGIFSHDLSGGTSARILLETAMPVEEARQRLVDRFEGRGEFAELKPVVTEGIRHAVEIAQIKAEGVEDGRVYRVDTSLRGWTGAEAMPADYPEFDRILEETFGDRLARYTVEFSEISETPIEAPISEAEAGTSGATPAPETSVPSTDTPATETTSSEPPAAETPATEAPKSETPSAEPAGGEAPSSGEVGDGMGSLQSSSGLRWVSLIQEEATAPAAEATSETQTPAADSAIAPETAAQENEVPVAGLPELAATEPGQSENIALVRCSTTMTLKYPVSEDGMRQAIRDVANAGALAIDADLVKIEPAAAEGSAPGTRWRIETDLTDSKVFRAMLDALQADFAGRPYFSSLVEVGGQIADDAKVDALAAIVVSLIGIVLYLWLRFQKVAYGVAAVLALVHDVLIVLGAIAISRWLSPYLGILLIDNFKISLPVIAAFLTVIGYSINDTIVVFDRIREVKGKSPKLTREMVDVSISATLSRTILTSFTTLIVVFVLYAIGGDAIHAFAFALLVGITVGTYSSIFIAAPILLWLSTRMGDR